MQIKKFVGMFVGIVLPFSLLANSNKPISCKDFHILRVIQSVKALDKKFQWNNPNCEIVSTRSIFPKTDKDGTSHFEKGLQLFIYQNKQLKFICLPGWTCKRW